MTPLLCQVLCKKNVHRLVLNSYLTFEIPQKNSSTSSNGPLLKHCCSVWDGFGETLSNKIQKLQNRAVRVITRSHYDASASSLLNNLHLDNLCLRRKKIKAGIMFKILNGDAPSYLQNLFSVHGSGYNLRNSEIKLNLPKPRTNYLKRSLCYSGALLWNNLPQNIRMLRSLLLFKNSLNYYYNL
jgi:hypothetical protein